MVFNVWPNAGCSSLGHLQYGRQMKDYKQDKDVKETINFISGLDLSFFVDYGSSKTKASVVSKIKHDFEKFFFGINLTINKEINDYMIFISACTALKCLVGACVSLDEKVDRLRDDDNDIEADKLEIISSSLVCEAIDIAKFIQQKNKVEKVDYV